MDVRRGLLSTPKTSLPSPCLSLPLCIQRPAINDKMYGGDGGDILEGDGGRDTYIGGDGPDVINAQIFQDPLNGVDIIRSGPGDDRIHAADGLVDRIDCGTGDDSVEGFDDNLDHVNLRNCEHLFL